MSWSGCTGSPGVPRLEPQLQNWTAPYHGLEGLRVHAYDTGTLALPEAVVYRGGSWFARRTMNVPAFVIEHPSAGLIVFDTGLGGDAERIWLERIGIVGQASGADLATQMRRSGLDPARVSYVVLSHLHFDHTGDVAAFPNASVVTARGEQEEAWNSRGLFDFYRAADWERAPRWIEIDYAAGKPFATFMSHHDLLGDGSVVLVDLHGHTSGSQGLLLRAPRGPVLLTGDASWVDENWRYAARPLWADNMEAWWQQIWRIRKLAQLVPSLVVVAGHDLSRLAKGVRDDVVLHPTIEQASATVSAAR